MYSSYGLRFGLALGWHAESVTVADHTDIVFKNFSKFQQANGGGVEKIIFARKLFALVDTPEWRGMRAERLKSFLVVEI